MTSKKTFPALAEMDPIEKDFMEALNRLKAGKPKNKALQVAAKAGKLRISVSTVATEAGHSRTLIGHKACKYPAVRDQIIALRTDPENPSRLQDIVAARRADVARLTRELKLAQTQNASLLIRMLKLEQEITRLERENSRLKKGARSQDKVVSLASPRP